MIRDEDGAGDAAAAPGRRARGRRRPGPARRPHRHLVRPPGHRLGAQGRARADRGRPPRPGQRRGHRRPPRHRREVPGRHRRAGRHRARRCSTSIQAGMLAEATAFRDARTVDVDHHRRGPRGRPDRLRPHPVGHARRGGRGRLAEDAVTVRCLQRPDGAVPASEDEPGTSPSSPAPTERGEASGERAPERFEADRPYRTLRWSSGATDHLAAAVGRPPVDHQLVVRHRDHHDGLQVDAEQVAGLGRVERRARP